MTSVIEELATQSFECVEELDVVIVGAGISGISAAWHIQDRCPGKTYAVLEARDSLGGTWDLHRFPGVRSDVDMFTFGFRFRPWPDASTVSPAHSIMRYLRDTVAESGVDRHIRYGTKVIGCNWSSDEGKWTVRTRDGATGTIKVYRCEFLFVCTGYYDYAKGYVPNFPGLDKFQGTFVHPQHWPEDLDYQGKKVVVIGSGATAVTVVPAMAHGGAGHVTMLQRSPSYVLSIPRVDPSTAVLQKLLPVRIAHPLIRWKNYGYQFAQFELSRRAPKLVRAFIRRSVRMQLPKGYPVDVHFRPKYNPWDERLCLVSGGDLFRAIRSGKAEVVTDEIETFTPGGIKLRSGIEIKADIVVSATGFNLMLFGGIEGTIDGKPVNPSESTVYKGSMLSGVPNLAFTIGYTNAPWTLKADLVSEYVCRVLNYMTEHGYNVATPILEGEATDTSLMGDFTPGYVRRSSDILPRQGEKRPWRLSMSYILDLFDIRHSTIDDGVLRFGKRKARVPAARLSNDDQAKDALVSSSQDSAALG